VAHIPPATLGNLQEAVGSQQLQAGRSGCPTNQFSFTFVGANAPAIVEACTNLVNPVWAPLLTNTFGGSSYFGDSQWMNYNARFYRITTITTTTTTTASSTTTTTLAPLRAQQPLCPPQPRRTVEPTTTTADQRPRPAAQRQHNAGSERRLRRPEDFTGGSCREHQDTSVFTNGRCSSGLYGAELGPGGSPGLPFPNAADRRGSVLPAFLLAI